MNKGKPTEARTFHAPRRGLIFWMGANLAPMEA